MTFPFRSTELIWHQEPARRRNIIIKLISDFGILFFVQSAVINVKTRAREMKTWLPKKTTICLLSVEDLILV